MLPLVACVYIPPVWDTADAINSIDRLVVGETTRSEVIELLGPPNFIDQPDATRGETGIWFNYTGRQSYGEVVAYGGGGPINEEVWWANIIFDENGIVAAVYDSKAGALAHLLPEQKATLSDVVALLGEPQMASGEQIFLYTCLSEENSVGKRLWRNLCRGEGPQVRLRFEFDSEGTLVSLLRSDLTGSTRHSVTDPTRWLREAVSPRYLTAPDAQDATAKQFLAQSGQCNVYAVFDVGIWMMRLSTEDLWLNVNREPVSPVVPGGYYTKVTLEPGRHELAITRGGFSNHVLPLDCPYGAIRYVIYTDPASFGRPGSNFAIVHDVEGRESVMRRDRILNLTHIEMENGIPSFRY